MLIFKNNLDKY